MSAPCSTRNGTSRVPPRYTAPCNAVCPFLLVGGAGGRLRGGRHLRVADETPLTNLQLTLLDKVGVPTEQLGDSTGQLTHLADV